MTHELTREYKRSAVHQQRRSLRVSVCLARTNPAACRRPGRREQDLRPHASRLDQLQRTLEGAVGAKTSNNRQRMLTQSRKLRHGRAAARRGPGQIHRPHGARVRRRASARMCGECAKRLHHACPRPRRQRASSPFEASYCVSCGACVKVCEERRACHGAHGR